MSKHRRRKARHLLNLSASPSAKSEAAAEKPVSSTISVIAYGPEKIHEAANLQPEQIRELIGKYPVLWVRVIGVTDAALVHKIGDIFLLHELALEDVMHANQRSKVEEYGDHLFVVLHNVMLAQNEIASEQMSLFMGKSFIVSFEETPGIASSAFAQIDERLRRSAGHLRTEQADYLLYAIVDSIIDGFFPIVEATGEALENLEDEIIEKTDRLTPARIHELKRQVLSTRRAIWPSRDALNVLTRDDTANLLSSRTRIYMRDCYDHATRIIDLVETQREICADLMDLYLSSVSNRMNEVIKVLTIITLLFMPPTLIAGIYGMNFPSIPDYKWKDGFFYSLLLMAVTALIVWVWAHRRGWTADDSATK